MKIFQNWRLERALPWLLIVCGTIGLIAAAILTVDAIVLLKNPDFKSFCDINPVVSCGSVTESDQGSVFGFPNPLISVAALPVVITTGVVMLAGAQLKRWYWLGLQAGTVLGLAFVHWLFYQSVYSIGSLCPFCIVTWIVTIATFWYVTLYNLEKGHIRLPKSLQGAGTFARKHHLDILALWFLIVGGLILNRFWYYYGPLLGF